jgi:predicted transcriptional regulator
MSEGIFEQYETVKEDMKFLTSSDVRSKIILSLKDGSKNLSDLRDELCLSSSTILHGMNQLEERNFILRESRFYSLSNTGMIAESMLFNMMKSVYSLKKFKTIFLNHEIGCIPNHLMKDLGSLKDSKIVKSTNTNFLKPQMALCGLVSKASNIKHISSVSHPENTGALFKTIIEMGGDVQLVLTRSVLEQLIKTTGTEFIKAAVLTDHLKLWTVKDNTKISFTMGNYFLAMGLFSTVGVYDPTMYMVSESNDAIKWGNSLFNHYLEQAEKFEPK